MMMWNDKDFAKQMQNILLSDNPNYFDVELDTPKTPNTNSTGRRFFLFRRKSGSQKSLDSAKIKTKNSPNKVEDQTPPPLEKRRSSFRCLLRSRSNSSSTVNSKATRASCGSSDYTNTPDYKNTGHFRERIGSYNESIAYLGSDDVFQCVNNESRANIKMTLPPKSSSLGGSTTDGVRRHSVGTFSSKEKVLRTNLFTDEVPKTQAPRPPTLMGTRIRERRRLVENLTAMDDILIVTAKQSEPGILWVNYLKTCFDKITKQRGRLPFNFLHLKIDNQQITQQLVQRCLVTKLQIVIVCPSLLSLKSSYLMSQLSIILKPERVLGMLLDVTEARVMEIHREALPSYKQWRRCIVRNQDQSFVSDLLGIATDILGRALRQQPLCSEATTPTSKPVFHENFTLFPRKVKIGQNKLLVIFTDPLVKEDWIKIKIEKTGSIIEITNVKRRNPYTVQFIVPETCMEVSTMIGVRIERNNIDLGCRPVKCESRLRELEQLLKCQDNPMEFMCQSIGISLSERDKLDDFFVQSFQKNVSPDFHLLSSNDDCRTGKCRESYPEEFPTLLHFAARWGLENLCLQLLECPGGETACEMRNVSLKTPGELAESAGFIKLAGSFKNYSQMNEFSTMYHYFKGISDTSTNNAIIEPMVVGPQSPKNKLKSEDIPPTKTDRVVDQEKDIEPEDVFNSHKPHAGYMEMSGSTSGSGSDVTDSVSHSRTDLQLITATNLNYLSIYEEDNVLNKNLDNVDSITEKVKKDLKLNNIPLDDRVLSNELTISEPSYYDSSEINNKTDDFSHECSMVLEGCNSLTPSESNSEYMSHPSNVPVNVDTKAKMNTLDRVKKLSKHDPFADYLIQPSNIPVEDHKLSSGMGSYMNQPALGSGFGSCKEESSHLRLNFKKKDENYGVNINAKVATTPTESIYGDNKSRSGTLKRHGSNVSKKSVDDELLEIIHDFKNNVFTIQEVEQLVATWKNRNDVQNGFRDKQEQLQKMREEYERIQHQMKEKLKRPTPFERMKRLFSRSKPEEGKLVNQEVGKEEGALPPLNPTKHRPISTLSLHSVSSSSSGRLSTGSVCSGASLGDSGTHSDNDDRKHGFCRNSGASGNSMDNYLIPPTPRPVLTPTSTCSSFDDKQFTRTRTSSASSEHYILFPSNMPVYTTASKPSSTKSDVMSCSVNSDYINLHTLNTIEETKEINDTPHLQPVPIKIKTPEVIYSKFEQKLSSDTCSTFRPPTSPIAIITSQNVVFEKYPTTEQFSAKKEFAEQLKKLTKSLDCLSELEIGISVEDSIKQLNQSILECEKVQELNNNNNNNNQNSFSINLTHDYMNLKIN